MSRLYHWWTIPQIRFAAELWRQNQSCDQIADQVMERFGILVTKNSIISLSRKHRDLMPMKTIDQLRQVQREGRKRAAAVRGMAA